MKKSIAEKRTADHQESFTGKNLTRFGGAGLVRRFFDKLGVQGLMTALGTDTRRKVDYSPADICLSMLYGLMMGVFRPSHMMELTADRVFQGMVRLKRFPSQSTISRFLAKITIHKAEHVGGINQRLLQHIRKGFVGMEEITLDLDSHVIPVFGSQHRAKKGYNPKKPGRKSYHPYLCFVGETRDCLGGLLRPGNCTNHHVKDFLKEMFRHLPGTAKVRIRADSGFFSSDLLKWLCKRKVQFAVVVRKQPWVQKQILHIAEWRNLDRRFSVGEIVLPLPDLTEVRFVVIREAVKSEEGPRKQLKLLSVEDCRHNYQVIATNMPGPEEDIWRFYNQRACCENFIKEGIYGFGLDTSVSRTWAGSRLYFELVMLAYNLMNWFKEKALGRKAHKEMAGTVRWKLFWIPARLTHTGRRVKVRLAEWWTYQYEFRRALEALR